MNIVSINVSAPTEIEYQGKKLSTGIFKKPVGGPVHLDKGNLAGDRQADLNSHGGEDKAVYAFSFEHYPYWRQVLKKPDLKPGASGENLTISGFDEAAVHIGDQLRIGPSLFPGCPLSGKTCCQPGYHMVISSTGHCPALSAN